jgi:hypothetical protein
MRYFYLQVQKELGQEKFMLLNYLNLFAVKIITDVCHNLARRLLQNLLLSYRKNSFCAVQKFNCLHHYIMRIINFTAYALLLQVHPLVRANLYYHPR